MVVPVRLVVICHILLSVKAFMAPHHPSLPVLTRAATTLPLSGFSVTTAKQELYDAVESSRVYLKLGQGVPATNVSLDTGRLDRVYQAVQQMESTMDIESPLTDPQSLLHLNGTWQLIFSNAGKTKHNYLSVFCWKFVV